MKRVCVGIIGGSGLYQMPGLIDVGQISVVASFGAPSDVICVGHLAGVTVAFLARQCRNYCWIPSQIP